MKRVCLGAFAGAHGVRGEAKVKTFTETEANVAAYGPVESEDRSRRFTLSFVRKLKDGLALVRAPEIASREDAAALSGVRLYVDRANLPDADEDEFYIEDLVGLEAFGDKGAPIGRVVAVYDFGAGPVLEIDGASGAVLVPFTDEAALAVDINGGRVTIAAAALAQSDESDGPT